MKIKKILLILLFFKLQNCLLFSAKITKAGNMRYFYTEKTEDEIIQIKRELLQISSETSRCPLCEEHLSGSINLRKHISEIHYRKRFLCLYCNAFVCSFSAIKNHVEKCSLNSEKTLDRKSRYKEIWLNQPKKWFELDEIVKSAIEKSKGFFCMLGNCDEQIFNSKAKLRAHIAYEHMGRRYRCECCKQRFGEFSQFYKHVKQPCPPLLANIAAGNHFALYCSEVWGPEQGRNLQREIACYESYHQVEEERDIERELDDDSAFGDDFLPNEGDCASGDDSPPNKKDRYRFYRRTNNISFYTLQEPSTVAEIKKEIDSYMGKADDFKCPKCEISFLRCASKKRNLERHLEVRHYNMRYLCGNCELYMAASDTSIFQHIKKCPGTKKYKKVYIYTSPTDKDLNRVCCYSERFSADSGLLICPVASCSEVVVIKLYGKSKALSKLREHIACEHMGRRYKCRGCANKFTTLALFDQHVRLKHKFLVGVGCDKNTFAKESWLYEEGFPRRLKSPDGCAAIIQQSASTRNKSAAAPWAAASSSPIPDDLLL